MFLDLDPGMMIWTWTTFIVFAVLLYKTALKPLLTSITNREDSIRNDLEESKKQREEAEELLEKHRKMIAEADAEAQRVINEAQELAKKSREEIVEKAREEATQVVEKARQEIERQQADAMKALREDIVDLAFGAAEKILTQAIDKNAHKKVIDEYIGSMPKSQKN